MGQKPGSAYISVIDETANHRIFVFVAGVGWAQWIYRHDPLPTTLTVSNAHRTWNFDTVSRTVTVAPHGSTPNGSSHYTIKFNSSWEWIETKRSPGVGESGGEETFSSSGGCFGFGIPFPEATYSTETLNGVTLEQKEEFFVLTSTENAGYVGSAVRSRRITTGSVVGSWEELEKSEYDYYLSTDTYGTRGDLKTIITSIKDGSTWIPVGTSYYRYYEDRRLVKFVLEPEAYARMKRATLVPETESDSTIAQYASNYYEYDSEDRVSKEIAAGCGSCVSGGLVGDTVTYEKSSNSVGFNSWTTKTTITRADGTKDISFTNYAEHVMLEVHEGAGSSPPRWYRFVKYDSAGRVILAASSPAVTGFDESKPDLLNYTSGNYQFLADSAGLIRLCTYNSNGLVDHETIKNGELGSEVKRADYTYTSHTAGVTVRPLASKTVYPDGITGVTTSYSYTFFSSTNSVEQKTTTLPSVSSGQNGSGSSDTRVTAYDRSGNPVWKKDERGYITKQEWDVVSGQMTKLIQDVDTGITTDEPSGWDSTSLPGTRQHLVTDYTYDKFSRLTERLDPAVDAITDASAGTSANVRSAFWKVYTDGVNSSEIRSAVGYRAVSGGAATLINPVTIATLNKDGEALQVISSKRTSGSGALASTDTFSQSDWKAWTINEYGADGLVSSSKDYHLIPSSGNGVSGTNYNASTYAYDTMGRHNRTVIAGGTIARSVFDAFGRVISKWVGTNDSGATASNPAGSGGSNNMLKTIEYEFDGGAAGAGVLTKVTRHAAASDTRVANYTYDWRNRRETADGEVDYFAKFYHDNLNRIIKGERYNTSVSGTLLARSEISYDGGSVTTNGTSESRTHDKQNRLTGKGSSTLAFDTNGNTTTDQNSRTLIYDAWNRLLEVKNGSTSLIRYEYDALGRRVEEGSAHLYYNTAWQVLEERNSSNAATHQYVWSPVYIDALVERDRDTDANGSLNERVYVLQDANFNVTSVTAASGTTVERFVYDPYGARTVMDGSWSGTTDAYDWRQGHQGGFYDRVVGNHMLFRNRTYDVETMRWLRQDPIGYADGMNRYQGYGSDPTGWVDPSGLYALPWWATWAVPVLETGAIIATGAEVAVVGGLVAAAAAVSYADQLAAEASGQDGCSCVGGWKNAADPFNRDPRCSVHGWENQANQTNNGGSKSGGQNNDKAETGTKDGNEPCPPQANANGNGNGNGGNRNNEDDKRGNSNNNGPNNPGNQRPPLNRLHKDKTYEQGLPKKELEDQRKRSTEEIVDSLKPGKPQPLRVKDDGTIVDGNTRIKVLEERGYHGIDDLPRTRYP